MFIYIVALDRRCVVIIEAIIFQGIQCFAFDEETHVVVTGGPDCMVRVWNAFVPSKASAIFIGHHAGITCLVLQNKGQTIYSLSRDRTIKVWDVQGQVCIQVRVFIQLIYLFPTKRFNTRNIEHDFILSR